jgi:hypothetical protein
MAQRLLFGQNKKFIDPQPVQKSIHLQRVKLYKSLKINLFTIPINTPEIAPNPTLTARN